MAPADDTWTKTYNDAILDVDPAFGRCEEACGIVFQISAALGCLECIEGEVNQAPKGLSHDLICQMLARPNT